MLCFLYKTNRFSVGVETQRARVSSFETKVTPESIGRTTASTVRLTPEKGFYFVGFKGSFGRGRFGQLQYETLPLDDTTPGSWCVRFTSKFIARSDFTCQLQHSSYSWTSELDASVVAVSIVSRSQLIAPRYVIHHVFRWKLDNTVSGTNV